MTYFARLGRLDPARTLIAEAESSIVIFTGQSSFLHSRLSPEQERFLGCVAPGFEPLRAGFPFHSEMLEAAGEPGLLAASMRNAAQAIASVWAPGYRAVLRGTLQRLADRTARALILVAGSCGLQLINAVWLELKVPPGLAVRVVALGPACFGRFRIERARITVIQGRRDRWSRLLYRGPVDRLADCGHLDYWTNDEVRRVVAAELLDFHRHAQRRPIESAPG